jgi:acyl-coenzyme A synthetase/AMP-(fatty) acid ligase/acyl carrier protein
LKFATPSFDASVFDIVSALGSGATLCLEKQDDLIPGPAFVDLLRQRRITAVTLPPSSLAVMPVEACPALRLLFVAGEACPAELVARWAPGRRMINGYGPTEATIWATFADCKPDGRTPAIGKPVANVSVYLLDRDLMPVPVGIPGEIYIGGPTLARGYLGRPDLTVASFVPDPWGEPGARLYRTGDVARFRADGNLEFLRRADAQVKIRGFRIEPGELEAALSALPEVAYAAAVVREETRGNPQLLAYVVPRAPSSVEAAAIRRTLESQLPRYLLPSKIIVLSELPRTPSGKVDRRALPRPQATPDDAPSPPQSSTEETVCRICAEVLKVLVGRNHNFFELGGHSLSAMQVVSRIREELGIEVPVRRLFEAATMAELCQGLGAATPRSKIRRLSRRPEVALR